MNQLRIDEQLEQTPHVAVTSCDFPLGSVDAADHLVNQAKLFRNWSLTKTFLYIRSGNLTWQPKMDRFQYTCPIGIIFHRFRKDLSHQGSSLNVHGRKEMDPVIFSFIVCIKWLLYIPSLKLTVHPWLDGYFSLGKVTFQGQVLNFRWVCMNIFEFRIRSQYFLRVWVFF